MAASLSFGHASFFGIGAYTVTLALVYWNLTPWLGIPLGMVVGAIAAVIIGMPTFRLRGHYFALSMLAYPLAILYFLQYLGFQEMSLPMHRENPAAYLEFTDQRLYTLVAVGLLAAGVLVCMLVENSRFGLALLAIRQNELAAEAAGINARRWKMRALVTSGTIAAAAGGLYACVLLVVTPDSVFGLLVSAQPVVVTLFGGVASIWGPVIGAADPGAAGRITERPAGQYHSRHPGRGVRRGDHRASSWPRRTGCSGPSATAGSAARCRHRPRRCPPRRCRARLCGAASAGAAAARCRTCRARSADCARSAR